MSESKPPIGDEHLVAYLDGELDREAQEAVESQLAADERLRHRLVQLEQSWNLLDRLPRAELGEEFAQTTVTLAAGDLTPSRTGRPRWQIWTLAAAMGFAAAAIPFQWIRRQQLRDLPVIQNIELYRVADSVQFLQQLEAEGLFDEEIEDVL
ncbi:MAG: hypothetical protein AAGF97_01155 [Planctomycetota bacterium]